MFKVKSSKGRLEATVSPWKWRTETKHGGSPGTSWLHRVPVATFNTTALMTLGNFILCLRPGGAAAVLTLFLLTPLGNMHLNSCDL